MVLIFPAVFNALLISILYVFVFNPIFAYMNIKFKIMKVIFSKVVMGYFQYLKRVMVREKTDDFEFVINAQHYSFEIIH